MNIDFLVTGTGRCGTTYMARLLTSLGIMCGHESIFNNDGLLKANLRLKGKIPIKTSYVSCNNIISGKKIEEWFDASEIKAESSYMAAPFIDSKILKNTKIIHVIRNPMDVLSSHILDVKFFKEDLNDPYQDFVFTVMPELFSIENEIERGCYYYVNWNRMIENKSSKSERLIHKVEKGCNSELMKFLKLSEDKKIDIGQKINSWNKGRKDLILNDIPDGDIKGEFLKIGIKYGYFQAFN
jgi:hypothetical protein